MSDIQWKDIPEYEVSYEACTDGQIRSKEGKTTYTERHGVRIWKSRILKQKISKDNTCRVSLWKNGKERTLLVHRLVALAFIEKIENKDYINHIDGSRLNNNVENLEWCNHLENNNHAFDNGLINTGKKVVLVNIQTKECNYFRSLSKASQFLNKDDLYLVHKLKRGLTESDGYEIFLKAK